MSSSSSNRNWKNLTSKNRSSHLFTASYFERPFEIWKTCANLAKCLPLPKDPSNWRRPHGSPTSSPIFPYLLTSAGAICNGQQHPKRMAGWYRNCHVESRSCLRFTQHSTRLDTRLNTRLSTRLNKVARKYGIKSLIVAQKLKQACFKEKNSTSVPTF